jgi:hypothetical protein
VQYAEGVSVSPLVLPDIKTSPRTSRSSRALATWQELAIGQTLGLRVAGRAIRITRLGERMARIHDPEFDEAVHAELLDPERIAPGACLRFRILDSPRVETSAPIESIEA